MTSTIARRKALPGTCGQCRADILAGIDADTCGLSARCDPRPLTRSGELLAVVDGRRTYALDIAGRLWWRGRYGIRSASREPVLAEHRCHAAVPDDWTLPPAAPAPTLRTEF